MTKKKKIILIMVILAVFLAAGASVGVYLYINRFDAGEYVQAVLDVSYKNKTDQYVEITGISEKEAEKLFEDNLDATMEGFENSQMPEEMTTKYRELFRDIAGRVSYTIGETQKQKNDTYEVSVIIKPITLFSDTYDTFQTRAQEYAQEVTDSVMNGEKMPEDEEMQEHIYEIYYDVLKERVDSGMLYGGARNVTLHVTKEGSRSFVIDQEDMDKLDSMLIESVDAGEENTEEGQTNTNDTAGNDSEE